MWHVERGKWKVVGPGTLQKSINVHETVNFADAISAQFIVHPQNTIKKKVNGASKRGKRAEIEKPKYITTSWRPTHGPQMPIPGAKININMLGTWPWSHHAPAGPYAPGPLPIPIMPPPSAGCLFCSRNMTIYVHFVCRRLNRQG